MANDVPAAPPAFIGIVDTMRLVPRSVRSFKSRLPELASTIAALRTTRHARSR